MKNKSESETPSPVGVIYILRIFVLKLLQMSKMQALFAFRLPYCLFNFFFLFCALAVDEIVDTLWRRGYFFYIKIT